jgi:hypothetical protein
MGRSLLDKLSRAELKAMIDKLLVILPANTRQQRGIDGLPMDRYLVGTDVAARHFSFLKSMVSRIRAAGISTLQDIYDTLYQFVVAIERLRNITPDLSSTRAREVLLWLGSHETVPNLVALIRRYADKARGIDLLVWILYKQFGAVTAERISFDVLRRRVPGFGEQVDPSAIETFQRLCRSAFDRVKTTASGQWFEGAAAGPLQRFSVHKLLNDANSKGLKVAGAKTAAGDIWRHAGKDYKAGANFDIFDLAVRGPNNLTCIASVADGGMARLIEKLDVLCRPNADQFDRVVEELRFLAQSGNLPGFAGLAKLRQADAMREVARRSILLVHPDSVGPLRAVLASHPQLPVILEGFMKLRSLTDRASALEALLDSIRAAVDLS